MSQNTEQLKADVPHEQQTSQTSMLQYLRDGLHGKPFATCAHQHIVAL